MGRQEAESSDTHGKEKESQEQCEAKEAKKTEDGER